MSNRKPYILSESEDRELSRLGFQHRVWKPETDDLINRSNIGSSEKVLDLGCGPGYITLDLCEKGIQEIWSLDTSENFIRHLKNQIDTQNLKGIKPILGNILEAKLPEDHFDACICRWVMIFLPEIETILRKVFNSLNDNGVFAIMEYGPFLDISLTPDSGIFNKVYQAVFQLLRKWGGNPDIGLLLPEMLKEVGFKEVTVKYISRSGPPGSDLWKWIELTSENHFNLVENGLISKEELEEYFVELANYREKGDSIFHAPGVQQIVARK